jgi:hypothetical protein
VARIKTVGPRNGIPHEIEALTADGFFSVDIALRGRRVAVEVDGYGLADSAHYVFDSFETSDILCRGEHYLPGPVPVIRRIVKFTALVCCLLRYRRPMYDVASYDRLALSMGRATF